jgi:glycerol-3-phosphate dehydrogenase
MAEKVIDLVFKKLGKKAPKSTTDRTPIYGGQVGCFEEFLSQAIAQRPANLPVDVIRSLVHNYGSQYRQILKYCGEEPKWMEILGTSTVLKAEVVHAVREEMAWKLGDVVFRRTDLGTGGDPGEEALRTCAELMASELGWDKDRMDKELEEVRTIFPHYPSVVGAAHEK